MSGDNGSNPSSAPTEVAVGVVYDDRGRVLVNRRPAGRPFAWLWEFPGGKFEAGETAEQALARELDEELGIRVARQRRLIRFSHDYDTFTVRLHVNEVPAFDGAVRARDNQRLEWLSPVDLQRVELLPANAPIVRAIRLPRVCLITDTRRFGMDRTLTRLAQHTARQRVLLIVREKRLEAGTLATFVRQARRACRRSGSLVIVHADCCDAPERLGADGIHLPSRALAGSGAADIVPPAGWRGASCHSDEELERARQRDCDYALLSPVEPTTSHPAAPALGWPGFARLCRDLPMPVYALGGLDWTDLQTAIDHGAQGVAMLGAAW